VVKIQVEAFWMVTQCTILVGYQRFGGPRCPHPHPEHVCSEILRNVDIPPQYYTTSQHRRPRNGWHW